MKTSISLCLALLFYLQNTEAQSFEHSFVAGYLSEAEYVKPYGSDGWLLACRGEPEPGAFFQDTLFIVVLNKDGQVQLRKNMKMPFEELHHWQDILALPDGSILACFESSLCDVAGYQMHLQKLDALGQMEWEINAGGVFGPAGLPDKWFLAPDGKLIGAGYNQVWKLDPENGNILWKAELKDPAVSNTYEIQQIAGTEDFIALGNPAYQKWVQTGSAGAPNYKLTDTLELPGIRGRLTPGPNGTFYAWQAFPGNQLQKIDLNFHLQVLPVQLVHQGTKSMCVGEMGLYLTESSSNTFKFTRFDLDGQSPVSLLEQGNWFNPQTVACNNGLIAVAGQEGSGLTNWQSYHITCTGAWVRTFREDQPQWAGENPAAAVTAIQQVSPVDTVALPAFPDGYNYNLNGGNFRVQVSNTGQIPIRDLCLNVVFDYNQFYFICFNIPARQIHFRDLDLMPGQSVWLDFGDIAAQGQKEVPAEICFWTSSPNEQPEAVHEDDRYCQALTYTVATTDPDKRAITCAPNPSDEFTEVGLPEGLEAEPWHLFDATGRLIDRGLCDRSPVLRLHTESLTNGMYLLRIGNRSGKLLVQH